MATQILAQAEQNDVCDSGADVLCDWVLDTINQTMNENCWLLFKGLTKCAVVSSELSDTAGVLGAIYKVQRKISQG